MAEVWRTTMIIMAITYPELREPILVGLIAGQGLNVLMYLKNKRR